MGILNHIDDRYEKEYTKDELEDFEKQRKLREEEQHKQYLESMERYQKLKNYYFNLPEEFVPIKYALRKYRYDYSEEKYRKENPLVEKIPIHIYSNFVNLPSDTWIINYIKGIELFKVRKIKNRFYVNKYAIDKYIFYSP